ncbi:MAG: ATP-binding cassette domain-containing protein [Chitinophagaceae bacterium]|nr:ATP-binding cassette domain-containing protein [Chitinophagaceae bacterium]
MIHCLEIDSIYLEIDKRVILSNIYLKCETGCITGLLGKNGTGKSCLMKILFGVFQCESSVRVDKKTVKQLYKQPNLVSFLPQFNFLPKSLSISDALYQFKLNYNLFENAFPEFTKKSMTKLYELSGGELRLVELYVILSSETKFTILDEPFTHLNPLQIEKVKQLIINRKFSKGILITDHLYNHILDISDSLYVLNDGKTNLVNSLKDIEFLGYFKIHRNS